MSRLQFRAHLQIALILCAAAVVALLSAAGGRAQSPAVTAPKPIAAAQAQAVLPAEEDVFSLARKAASSQSVPHVAPDGADQQAVLLHNGRVLTGRIRKNGDSYIVSRATGQIRLASTSVQLVAGSQEEIYAILREKLSQDNPREHLALAEWCLREDLLAEARLELAAATALAPDSDSARQLLLRLESRERVLAAEKGGTRKEAPETPPLQEARANDAPERGENNPLVAAARAVPDGAAHEGVADADLLRWNLSDESVRQFTRSVQPLLLATCTTAGCHSEPQQPGFQLIRTGGPSQVNRALTETNLRAVLEWIDRQSPNNSPMLAMAVLAHDRPRQPQFSGLRGRQFAALATWISSLDTPEIHNRTAPTQTVRKPPGAFRTAMQADASAPGRRGTRGGVRTGPMVPKGKKPRTAARATGEFVDTAPAGAHEAATESADAAEEADRSKRPAAGTKGGGKSPTNLERNTGGRYAGRARINDPDTIPDAGQLGARPRVSVYEGQSGGSGAALMTGDNSASDTPKQQNGISGFLKKLNPFRRTRR